jgi:hypothetical protein
LLSLVLSKNTKSKKILCIPAVHFLTIVFDGVKNNAICKQENGQGTEIKDNISENLLPHVAIFKEAQVMVLPIWRHPIFR